MTNKHAFASLCAAALAAAGARPALAQDLLQRCDKAMVDAESMTRRVAACFDASAMPADVANAASAEPLLGRLVSYYTFGAYLAGNPDLCAPLALLSREDYCRNDARNLAFVRAGMGAPAEFIAACRQASPPKGVADENQKAQCCALLAENRDRPNSCAKLVPRCIPDAGSCEAFFTRRTGDAGACRNIQPGREGGCLDAADCQKQRADCQAEAAFVKAFRARNAALCGASDRCRVLMGGGNQVLRELTAKLTGPGRWFLKRGRMNATIAAPKDAAAFKGFSCAGARSEPNRKAAAAALDTARSCLSDIDLALSRVDLATAQGIDDREEKLARMDLRLNAYFVGSAVSPALVPAPAVKRRR